MENTTDAPPTAPVPASVRTPAPSAGEDVELLTITEAARRVGVSRQALTRRVKRGTLRAHRAAIEGELVWRIPLSELARAYPEVGAAPGAAPVRTPQAPVHAPPAPSAAPTADLVVLRSDYRAMLVQVKEQAQAAEARELRARRALVPALVGLAIAAVAIGVTWTAWRGASSRVTELGQDVHAAEAASVATGAVLEAVRLDLHESRQEALTLQGTALDAQRAENVTAAKLVVEREARQRAEVMLAWGVLRRIFGI